MDKSEQAASIFNKYAEAYQEKFMNTEMYHDTFDAFCELLPEKAHVLEVACGPGNITRYLLNKRPDIDLLGIDLAPKMVALAERNNPEAAFRVMDCRNILSLDMRFEAVMCGFCLPYLSRDEVMKLFADFNTLLNSGGVIYLSTMEDEYASSSFKKGSGGDEIFMHFYTEKMLQQMLATTYFDIAEVKRKSYAETTGTITTDLIMIARKNN